MRPLVFVSLLLCSTARAAEPWSWSQPVQYQENHDPSMIWLSDGRKLTVEYKAVPWNEVDRWPRGKALLLIYDSNSGPYLFDRQIKKALPILDGLDKHPIDIALDDCLRKDETTAGRVGCYGRAEARWDAEVERAYQKLLSSLDPARQAGVREAQQSWVTFRDAQIAAIYAVNGPRDGTIWKVTGARQAARIAREQAQRLAGLMTW
jgi:uncharacterized protein YecT (DUF1311 family)